MKNCPPVGLRFLGEKGYVPLSLIFICLPEGAPIVGTPVTLRQIFLYLLFSWLFAQQSIRQ